MRTSSLFSCLVLASSILVGACDAADDASDIESTSDELVQFPAAAFAGAPLLAYGQTSAVIETSKTKWGVVRLSGTTGDELMATVVATTPDRLPRAYLVEKRTDGKYVAVLSGTRSTDGIVRANLAKTQEYFIVFRDASRRNASFTLKLERAGGLPAACSGTPLLNQGIVDRTPQAQTPGLAVTGEYRSTIRRCNVATGCADPVVNGQTTNQLVFSRRSDGKWVLSGVLSAEHDGATGELTGSVNVRADDGRAIAVAIKGAATTSCVSLSGRTRSAIDDLTYYDVEVTFQATTPPVAPRTTHPAAPPPPECDGQEPITDEELLARFPRSAATVVLGAANVQEDAQYCHPETGCRAWSRGAPNPGISLRATAHVLSSDSLGISFYSPQLAANPTPYVVEDGVPAITSDVLGRGGAAVANTALVSDTHLLVKETNVRTAGDWKYRRFVCIPIPPHP